MSKTEYLRTEGKKGLEDLCALCADLNGSRGAFGQLQLNNGRFVSDLLDFMENNPGVIRAMYNWIEENYEEELNEEDDVDEELDDDICASCGEAWEHHSDKEREGCEQDMEDFCDICGMAVCIEGHTQKQKDVFKKNPDMSTIELYKLENETTIG